MVIISKFWGHKTYFWPQITKQKCLQIWSRMKYSSDQKNLNDQSMWHNFFVSEPIGFKFWSNLNISIFHFSAKNWRHTSFLEEVMIFWVVWSRSKVSKRSRILVPLKVKTRNERFLLASYEIWESIGFVSSFQKNFFAFFHVLWLAIAKKWV